MTRKLPREPDPLTKDIAEQLLWMMQDQGLTWAALARRVGGDAANLNNWLHGATRGERAITLDKLQWIADGLGADVAVILSRRRVTRRGLLNLTQIAERVGLTPATVRKMLREAGVDPEPTPGELRFWDFNKAERAIERAIAAWPPQQRSRYERVQRERRGA